MADESQIGRFVSSAAAWVAGLFHVKRAEPRAARCLPISAGAPDADTLGSVSTEAPEREESGSEMVESVSVNYPRMTP